MFVEIKNATERGSRSEEFISIKETTFRDHSYLKVFLSKKFMENHPHLGESRFNVFIGTLEDEGKVKLVKSDTGWKCSMLPNGSVYIRPRIQNRILKNGIQRPKYTVSNDTILITLNDS